MRIAYLLPNLHVTGGARVGIEFGRRLVQRGHQVYILIPKGKKKLSTEGGFEVLECGLRVNNPLLAVFTGMSGMAVQMPKVDVIVASMPTYVLLANIFGKLYRVPTVNNLLNDDVHFFDDGTYLKNSILLRIYQILARNSIKTKNVVANSHWTATRCVKEGGNRPVAIVPSGYDDAIFYPDDRPFKLHNPLRVLTVGRKPHWKGFRNLVDGLNLVDGSQHPFTLRILTQDDLDTSDINFKYEIIKPENDSELAGHYRWADIFIHTSWFEGFGLPPLEAQACGKVVLATNSGGVREFLKDGENAVLIPPREPRTLARQFTNLSTNPEFCSKLVLNGLESCRNFTWDQVVSGFEQVLRDVVDQK